MKTPMSERLANNSEPGENGCIVWTGERNDGGYGRVAVRLNGARRKIGAHRIAYEEAKGVKLLPSVHVCHKCDNPPCINPEHLVPCTPKQNQVDSAQKLRRGSTKLTQEQVLDLRVKHDNGVSINALALEFGISRTTARRIALHIDWAWLQAA